MELISPIHSTKYMVLSVDITITGTGANINYLVNNV